MFLFGSQAPSFMGFYMVCECGNEWDENGRCRELKKHMTRAEFLDFQRDFYAKNMEITKKKNTDYGAGSNDAFISFRSVEMLNIATAEQGFLTRMTDKMVRLSSFINNGKLEVNDESVQDTLSDLSNYCSLLAGFLKEKAFWEDS